MAEKLSPEVREQAIREIIEADMEQFYKPRDVFDAFYNGILPYKEMSDEEIREWYEEREESLPTIGLKNSVESEFMVNDEGVKTECDECGDDIEDCESFETIDNKTLCAGCEAKRTSVN